MDKLIPLHRLALGTCGKVSQLTANGNTRRRMLDLVSSAARGCKLCKKVPPVTRLPMRFAVRSSPFALMKPPKSWWKSLKADKLRIINVNHRQMFSQPRDTDRTDCQEEALVVALVGNPNTGKSTVFNRLTGLKQHTGNWPGKTVANARGSYLYQMQRFVLVDLPGTYSLAANSADEEVTRDFLCSGEARVAVVVVDATCLARNLHLVLQVLEMTEQVVLCVNLLDEAERKHIQLDWPALANILGVPVIGTNAATECDWMLLKMLSGRWQAAHCQPDLCG